MNTLIRAIFLFISLMGFHPILTAQAQEDCAVLILGSGVGGLTAANYLARAGITPVVITGPVMGGTITQSPHVENWPGELRISGVDLAEKLQIQAERNGAQLRHEVVVAVDLSSFPYKITTRDALLDNAPHKYYRTKACIIALGAVPNLLHVPGEKEYWSKGVYNCAVCDGALYRGKSVAVVGGGDSAILEVQYLANIASSVHLLVRGQEFRAKEKQRVNQVLSLPNVHVHYQTQVRAIKGKEEQLTHLVLTEGKEQKTLNVDALFLAIGFFPNTAFFDGQLEKDANGYILLKHQQEASKKGVYAIGDVADPEFKQAISAAGDGAKAALQAQQWLALSNATVSTHPRATTLMSKIDVIDVVSLSQFNAEMEGKHGYVLVDFYSSYCGPCRSFAPMYSSWAEKYGHVVKFLKVNAEVLPNLFHKFHIHAVPSLLLFDANGQIVYTMVGLQDVAVLEEKLKKICAANVRSGV